MGERRSTPLADALGQLAIAAGGFIKFNRDGTYTMKPLSYAPSGRIITFENMWKKPAIKQLPIIYGVTVRYLIEVSSRLESAEELVLTGNTMGRNIEVISNFILNAAEARRIGSLALAFFNHRLEYRVSYRGDMSIEPGDVIGVETDYGVRNVLILEHEINYDTDEYLQGDLVGVEV